jgi:hypothetical protein
MKARVVWKGGPGSGNFGHFGRLGKVGGSIGREAYSSETKISKYLVEWSDELRTRGPYKQLRDVVAAKMRSKFPNASEEELSNSTRSVLDAMSIDAERFDYYDRKYDLGIDENLRSRFVEHNGFIDREIERRQYTMHRMMTVKNQKFGDPVVSVDAPESWEHSVWSEKVGLVGSSVDDAIAVINKHGVTVGIDNGYENDPNVHDAISTLSHVLDKEPVVRDVFERNARRVRFISRPNESFSARAMGTEIEVNLSPSWYGKYGGTSGNTWVHEIGHLSERDSDYVSWTKMFTAGMHASLYSWKSPSESYAEAFTAYVTNRAAYENAMPEKMKFFDDLYGSVK